MNQLAVKEWPQSVEKLQKSIIDNFLGFDDFFNINPLASLPVIISSDSSASVSSGIIVEETVSEPMEISSQTKGESNSCNSCLEMMKKVHESLEEIKDQMTKSGNQSSSKV